MSSCISDSLHDCPPPSSDGACENAVTIDASIQPPRRPPDFAEFGAYGWVIPDTGTIVAQHKNKPRLRASIPYSDRPGVDPRAIDFDRFHAFMDIVRQFEWMEKKDPAPATPPPPQMRPEIVGRISVVLLTGNAQTEHASSGTMA